MITFEIHTDGLDAISFELEKEISGTEEKLIQRVKNDTTQFVPYKTGNLTENTTIQGNKIVYPAPYARFLYYGKLMVDPLTGSAWARKGVKKILTQKNLVFERSVHPQAQSHWFEASAALNLSDWVDFAKKEFGE